MFFFLLKKKKKFANQVCSGKGRWCQLGQPGSSARWPGSLVLGPAPLRPQLNYQWDHNALLTGLTVVCTQLPLTRTRGLFLGLTWLIADALRPGTPHSLLASSALGTDSEGLLWSLEHSVLPLSYTCFPKAPPSADMTFEPFPIPDYLVRR